MKRDISAAVGEPYRIRKSGHLYTLTRRRADGRKQTIVMDRNAAISICNALIDLIETGNKHNE